MLPIATCALEPVEVVSVFDLTGLDEVSNFLELVTLVDVYGNHSFDLDSDQ